MPVAMISASWSLRQLSFDRIRAAEESRNSRTGSASASGKNEESDGPMARTIIFFGCVPVTMKPPISTLSPVSTRKRVEMFPRIAGEALGVAVAVAVGEDVGVGVTVGVSVGAGLDVA